MTGLLIHDLFRCLKLLMKSPLFACSTILMISVGIGASTACFRVLHAVLSFQMPLIAPERLVSIDNQEELNSLQRDMFHEATKRMTTLESIAEYHVAEANYSYGASSERRSAAEVSAEFFRVLGAHPALGRDFAPDEDQPGRDMVALVSHKLWRDSCHGDVGILGNVIHLNGLEFTVIGVLPPGVEYPQQTDIWVPTIFDSDRYLREAMSVHTSAIGRIRAGAHLTLVRAEVERMTRERLQAGETLTEAAMPLVSLLEPHLTEKIRPSLFVLNGAVIFVLLIMCANVAHLVLARTGARMNDIAVMYALGANSWVIIRQEAVEPFMVSLLGGAVGLGIGLIVARTLFRFSPGDLGRYAYEGFGWPVAVYSLIATLFFAVSASVGPSLFAVQQSSHGTVNPGSRRSFRTRRLYDKLIISEIGLALILLGGAGMFFRTLSELNKTLFAYDTGGLLMFSISPHGPRYLDYQTHTTKVSAINALYNAILAGTAELPGVVSNAVSSQPPNFGNNDSLLPTGIGGKPIEPVRAFEYIVTPSYFSTMGIRILNGRVPSSAELHSGRAIVVSEDFAHQLWPGDRAVGKTMILPLHGLLPFKVVAVSANSYRPQMKTLASPEVYLFIDQAYCPSATFILRTRERPELLERLVRNRVAMIDSEQPLFDFKTMDQRIAENEVNQRFAAWVLSGFALIAVLLAVVGFYSAMTLNFQSRRHEMGIRSALGAPPRGILRMLLLDSCKVLVPGIGLGLIGVFAIVRGVSALVFGVTTFRIFDTSIIAVVFSLGILATAYLAARQSATADPAELLREE